MRDAPCALADAARADKLGEEARAASEGTPLALVNCASGPQPRSRAGSAAAGVKPESSFDDFQQAAPRRLHRHWQHLAALTQTV